MIHINQIYPSFKFLHFYKISLSIQKQQDEKPVGSFSSHLLFSVIQNEEPKQDMLSCVVA